MSGGAPTHELASLSTTELAALLDDEPPVLLLPVGSTEAHGPHLPLATDVIIARETARRAADALADRDVTALILPPFAYAVTEFVAAFPGTISVRAETVRTLIEEVVASLFGQGFPMVSLVNGHVEPEHARMLKHVARDVTARGDGVLLFPDQRLPPTVSELGEEFARGGGHAGGYETSLVLAAAPDLVDDAARAALPANFIDIAAKLREGARDAAEAGGPEAYFGDPAGATAAEGERLYGVLAQMVVEAVLAARAAHTDETRP